MSDITVTMPAAFLGQVCDGVRVLVEQWEATAEVLNGGYVEDICIRECSDADEAEYMAKSYSEILTLLERQLTAHYQKEEA